MMLRSLARAGAVGALLLVAVPAAADGTGACHCYRDRTFDPARPDAADPYILATVRSSLLSAVFGPPKRELVTAVMTGTAPEDLWIAHWAAPRVGRDAASLLDERVRRGSWRSALARQRGLAGPFAAALARAAPDAELAAVAADDVVAAHLGADPAELAAARAQDASTSEVILSALLAARMGTTPATVLAPVKAGKVTWGGALQALGLAPKDLDRVVREAVKPVRRAPSP